MWRRLRNLVLSLNTYADLSPDLVLRHRVARTLRSRPCRSVRECYELFWQPRSIPQDLVAFVYDHLEAASGLPWLQVMPCDRLIEDLQLTLVCWDNWEFDLCDAVYQRFGADISDRFNPSTLSTVEDLILGLNQALNYS